MNACVVCGLPVDVEMSWNGGSARLDLGCHLRCLSQDQGEALGRIEDEFAQETGWRPILLDITPARMQVA